LDTSSLRKTVSHRSPSALVHAAPKHCGTGTHPGSIAEPTAYIITNAYGNLRFQEFRRKALQHGRGAKDGSKDRNEETPRNVPENHTNMAGNLGRWMRLPAPKSRMKIAGLRHNDDGSSQNME
jgi:hypothetical protein